MILSRTLARRRIARGDRPGFRAAWGPVVVDTIAITLVLALLWMPLVSAIYLAQLALWQILLVMFAVIFVPFQIVVTLSTIWAVRSRVPPE